MSKSIGFLSEKTIEEKKEQRKQEWEATFARMNQKAPALDDQPYDPRSLAEQLADNKIKKQEEFEERIKLKNLFRGIDDEEAAFLSDMAIDSRIAERERQKEIDAELASFREKLSAPKDAPPLPAVSVSAAVPSSSVTKTAPQTTPKPTPKTIPKKATQRGILAGAIKRKKTDEPAKSAATEQDPSSKKAKTS